MSISKKKNGNRKPTPQKKWKKILSEKGIKQKCLAQKTGISKEHISNILSERVILTEENRNKINTVLETTY